MKDVFEKYLRLLRQDRGDKTEHSDRSALETLLNKAAEAAYLEAITLDPKLPGTAGRFRDIRRLPYRSPPRIS